MPIASIGFINEMKENFNIKVVGNNVILVPYKEHFVPKYHNFMSDER